MTTPSTPTSSGFQIPLHILDDLCSRFIINLPEEERQDLIRIFFQIELAHWFYLDFYCQDNEQLRACGIKDFSAQIFHHCPTLIQHADNVDTILGSWREYKMAVPTYGAIMLDPTQSYCLLVQGFWSKTSWGFPKGKVNEEEAPDTCAVREVYEETGYNIAPLLDKDEYLEYKNNDQMTRLYIVPGIPMDTQFAPRTRKEIKTWDWFRVDQLPSHKRDPNSKTYFNLSTNAFFMVIPFVRSLRKWIGRRVSVSDKEGDKRARSRHGSSVDSCQRLQPVQLFASEELAGKTAKGRSHSQSSVNASQKQKNVSSPKKILKRGEADVSSSGEADEMGFRHTNPLPNLLDFGHVATPGKRQSRKDIFQARAWNNFHLDIEAVLSCL